MKIIQLAPPSDLRHRAKLYAALGISSPAIAVLVMALTLSHYILEPVEAARRGEIAIDKQNLLYRGFLRTGVRVSKSTERGLDFASWALSGLHGAIRRVPGYNRVVPVTAEWLWSLLLYVPDRIDALMLSL